MFYSDPRLVTRRLSVTIRCSVVTGLHQAVIQVAETSYEAKVKADTELGNLGRTGLLNPISSASLNFLYKHTQIMFMSQGFTSLEKQRTV